MTTRIKLRYVRHSAKKLRPLARLFVNKNLESAIITTSVMPQDSAGFLRKALLMAKAAATQKEFNMSDVVITEIMATEGPKIKRIRPNARGRTNAYQKHLAHLVVTVSERKAPTVVKKAKVTKAKKEKI